MHTQKGRFTAEVQKKVKEKVGSIDNKLRKEEKTDDELHKGGGKEGGVDIYLQKEMLVEEVKSDVNNNLHKKEKEGVDDGVGGDDNDDDSNNNNEEGEGSKASVIKFKTRWRRPKRRTRGEEG